MHDTTKLFNIYFIFENIDKTKPFLCLRTSVTYSIIVCAPQSITRNCFYAIKLQKKDKIKKILKKTSNSLVY